MPKRIDPRKLELLVRLISRKKWSDPRIAKRVGISPQTVYFHRKRLGVLASNIQGALKSLQAAAHTKEQAQKYSLLKKKLELISPKDRLAVWHGVYNKILQANQAVLPFLKRKKGDQNDGINPLAIPFFENLRELRLELDVLYSILPEKDQKTADGFLRENTQDRNWKQLFSAIAKDHLKRYKNTDTDFFSEKTRFVSHRTRQRRTDAGEKS